MDNEKMGRLITELRKLKQMTQKDLAARLNVTDKAVSKWERGLSCPDISLLPSLSEILGVTIGELLGGERYDIEVVNAEKSIDNVLQYAVKSIKINTASILNISAIVFTIVFLVGILTCIIIDVAISGRLTWSLIPISACVFSWFVFVPTIKYGLKGILTSLIMLSVLIVPFFLILNNLVDSGGLLLPIGIRMSILSAGYLWIAFGLFKILRSRKLIATAVSLLLGIFFISFVNIVLSRIIYTALFDVWDVIYFAIVIVLSAILFFIDYTARKKRHG